MDFKYTKIDVNIEGYRKWVDSVIRSDLQDPNNEPGLFELAKTCRKYGNKKCRFCFGKFFKSKTIITQLLADSVPPDAKL